MSSKQMRKSSDRLTRFTKQSLTDSTELTSTAQLVWCQKGILLVAHLGFAQRGEWAWGSSTVGLELKSF